MSDRVIAVDLDGTLASHYDAKFDKNVIGDPIPDMMSRVKKWLDQGKQVKLFTARAVDPENIPPIRKWLDKYELNNVDITAIKDPSIVKIYDDRAVQVRKNSGELLGNPDEIKESTNKGEIIMSKLFDNMDEFDLGELVFDEQSNLYIIDGDDSATQIVEVVQIDEEYEDLMEGDILITENGTQYKFKHSLIECGQSSQDRIRKLLKKEAEEWTDEDWNDYITENEKLFEIYGEVKEPGEEAGVRKNPDDSMPINTKKGGDSVPKDTVSKGDLSQAAGYDKFPKDNLIDTLKMSNAKRQGEDDGGTEAGTQPPKKIAKETIKGLFK